MTACSIGQGRDTANFSFPVLVEAHVQTYRDTRLMLPNFADDANPEMDGKAEQINTEGKGELAKILAKI